MSKNKQFYQGEYNVVNKDKYIGKSNPIYRSGWEKRLMWYLDHNKNIVRWSSEPFAIPYLYTVDGKIHNYYPDFYAEVRGVDGKVKRYLTEVKPKSQCQPPKKPKTNHKKAKARYMRESLVWTKNQCKWNAAKAFCKKKGIIFNIVTEDSLF